MPLLAHATMEPMNCTVQLKPDACEIWLGTQVMTRVQQTAAQLLGLPPEKVTVHNHLLGGGFGRRLEPDMALKAIRVAQHLNGEPLKVVWTREEDIQHDVYRPAYRDTIEASLKDGKLSGWKYRVSGSSVMARWFPPGFSHGVDVDGVDSAIDMPYDVPNFHVEFKRVEPPALVTGFWRGVGPNNNVFAVECFMDELAKKAGQDPVAFRLAHLHGSPRHQAVLKLVAEKSNWGSPLPPRVGRGVSVQPSFASYIATVVEAEVDHHGEVMLRRIHCVVDTGIAVNPDTDRSAIAGRAHLRPHRRAVWRSHGPQGPRAAIELQQLSHAAHRPDAADRRACDEERRSAGRHRRNGRHRGSARLAQRDLRRHRHRAPTNARRP